VDCISRNQILLLLIIFSFTFLTNPVSSEIWLYTVDSTPAIEYNGIPFGWLSSPVVLQPDSSSITRTLPNYSTKKIHVIQTASFATEIPQGSAAGSIKIFYQDGTFDIINLIMGVNTAEWAYDRPENQESLAHNKIPPAFSWLTSIDSNYTYYGHSFYTSIVTQPKYVDHIQLVKDIGTIGLWITAITMEVDRSTGSISLDQSEYTDYTQTATVTVIDQDMNLDPTNWDHVSVTVKSYDAWTSSEIGNLELTLEEDGLNSGIFTREFAFDPTGSDPSELNVTTIHPGAIHVMYTDAIDAEGHINEIRSATSTYKFYYDVAATLDGELIDQEVGRHYSDSASVKIKVHVMEGSQPAKWVDLYINNLPQPFGQTDENGDCHIVYPLGSVNINEIKIKAQKDGKTGESKSFEIRQEELKGFSIFLYGKDIAFFDSFILLKHYFGWLTDPDCLSLTQTTLEGALDIIQKGETYFINPSLANIAELTAYWYITIDYHPLIGDIISVKCTRITVLPEIPDGLAGPEVTHRLELSVDRGGMGTIHDKVYWYDEWMPEIPKSPDSLILMLQSPAVVYVTAPDGSHIGYDPESGQFVMDSPAFISNPGEEPFTLFIPHPLDGQYLIDVIGTGAGTYDLNMSLLDENDKIIQEVNYSDTTSSGEQDRYIFNTRYIDLPIWEGWNFISNPTYLDPDYNTLEELLKNVDKEDTPVWLYDAEEKNWIQASADTVPDPMTGIWVYSSNLSSIILHPATEPATPAVKHLYPGWNAIGLGSWYEMETNTALSSLSKGFVLNPFEPQEKSWSIILEFDNGLQIYFPPQVNGISTGSMQPGRGYWIYMNEPADLVAMTG